MLTIPLGNSSARYKYKSDKAALEQLLLQIKQVELTIIPAIDNDVTKIRTDLLKVDSTRQARMYAEEALEAEQTKLQHGKNTSFFVLQAQQTLTARRSDEIQALANYNIDLDQLAFDEGTILERNHIELRSNRKGGPADAQFGGGGRDLAGVLAQNICHHLTLQVLPGVFEAGIAAPPGRRQFQIPHGQALSFRHDDGAANIVLQLPDISRPMIAVQGAQGILIESQAGLVLLLGKTMQEKLRQQADVSLPLAQGRQDDSARRPDDKTNPRETSRPSCPCANPRWWRSPPGRRFGIDCRPPTRSMHCSWRKRRSLTCNGSGNLADFVQKKRPFVGALEAPFSLRMRAGEGALSHGRTIRFPGASPGMALQLMATNGPSLRALPW
jgi:hypothetical protein